MTSTPKTLESTTTSLATPLDHLPPSLVRLVRRVEAEEDMTPAKARALLLDADIAAEDLAPWADFDHPAADSYGRKLIHDGGFFELMVMSWVPGDYSAIHDHGYAEWGAVKLFGAAEHAVFALVDGTLETRNRAVVPTGTVLAVGHDLIHQMGNVGSSRYLTLHLYGSYDREGDVTGDARIFDLDERRIQFTGGGVFFSLPENKIDGRGDSLAADFPTRLRHNVELLRRIHRTNVAAGGGSASLAEREERLRQELYAATAWPQILAELEPHLEKGAAVGASSAWSLLFRELRALAELERELAGGDAGEDDAALWDELVGPRHLDAYVAAYLRFLAERHGVDFARSRVLSLGCRTGLVELHLQRELGVAGEGLLGLEAVEPLRRRAAERIKTGAGDFPAVAAELDPAELVLASHGALQRECGETLASVVAAIAAKTPSGGRFAGDFAPSTKVPVASAWKRNDAALYLEQASLEPATEAPRLAHEALDLKQEDGRLRSRSRRELLDVSAPPTDLAELFIRHFDAVHLYDALTLAPLPRDPASWRGSRYLLVAEKR